MGMFKKNHQNSHHVRKSFENVKKDTSSLFDWVTFLHQKIQEQEGLIRQQQKYLRSLHQYLNTNMITETHVKKLIDQPQKNVNLLHHQIRTIHKKLDVMASLHDRHHTRINELHTRLSPEKKVSALKEKLIKNITRNSKAYVKNAIISYIEKYHEISALQLKELVVDEQHLCSKSSFYRLLQELENKQKVMVVKKGKHKNFLVKLIH
jgi:predicted DNA-binding protein